MLAFDGVLVSHEHRQVVIESQIGMRKSVVIGKRMLDQLDTRHTQAFEKPLRVADRRHRVYLLTLETDQRLSLPVAKGYNIAATQLHRVLAISGEATIADSKVDALQSAQRFAQWSCWQQPSIAKTAHTIDDADFHIACQRVVLQTVIGDQYIAAGIEQQSRCGGTDSTHRYRYAGAADQTRFVANT